MGGPKIVISAMNPVVSPPHVAKLRTISSFWDQFISKMATLGRHVKRRSQVEDDEFEEGYEDYSDGTHHLSAC